jgi:heme-degrading monooxygenase HmoA
MYARVVTLYILPDRLDEAIKIFRDSISPASKQQKGNKGGYFLTDHNTGKAVSIAFWETEADMVAGENSSYLREQIVKVASAFTAPPITEHYEVSVE